MGWFWRFTDAKSSLLAVVVSCTVQQKTDIILYTVTVDDHSYYELSFVVVVLAVRKA